MVQRKRKACDPSDGSPDPSAGQSTHEHVVIDLPPHLAFLQQAALALFAITKMFSKRQTQLPLALLLPELSRMLGQIISMKHVRQLAYLLPDVLRLIPIESYSTMTLSAVALHSSCSCCLAGFCAPPTRFITANPLPRTHSTCSCADDCVSWSSIGVCWLFKASGNQSSEKSDLLCFRGGASEQVARRRSSFIHRRLTEWTHYAPSTQPEHIPLAPHPASNRIIEYFWSPAATTDDVSAVPAQSNPNINMLLSHPVGARFLTALQVRLSHSNSNNAASLSNVWLDPLSQSVKHFDIASRICAVHRIIARQPIFASLPVLHAQIQHTLTALQIDSHKLYSHQCKGIQALLNGSHLALSTSTASGKSLVYNLFALYLLLQSSSHRIILVFPTKSLAHDQLRSLNSFMSHVLLHNDAGLAESIQVSTLDGDTPTEIRSHILARSHIILTNPDMLHASILPHHNQCSALLSGLRFVVFDESHVYRGAFGVHVACIIRRLRRIHALHCATHAPGTSKLQFMTCSATLQNATEHFHTLTGIPVQEGLVTLTETDNGSGCGEKLFVLWNPPLLHPTAHQDESKKSNTESNATLTAAEVAEAFMITEDLSKIGSLKFGSDALRQSAFRETATLLSWFVQLDIQTLTFCSSRRACELLLHLTHSQLQNNVADSADLIQSVQSYRGGYDRVDRRSIEHNLFSGKLRGCVATNALELGIDIGDMDVTLHQGFPGSISSVYQQAGRAGRNKQPSLAIFVASDSSLDQYILKHSDWFFNQPMDSISLDINNPHIIKKHILCAAFESVLHADHELWLQRSSTSNPFFNTEPCFADISVFSECVADLAQSGCLSQLTNHNTPLVSFALVPLSWHALYSSGRSSSHPAHDIAIRNIDTNMFRVETWETSLHDSSKQQCVLLDSVDERRAIMSVHPGAVYLHRGRTYVIERLDFRTRVATANLSAVKYITKPEDHTEVAVMQVLQSSATSNQIPFSYGQVQVSAHVSGYHRVDPRTHRNLSSHDLALPAVQYTTFGVWLTLPVSFVSQFEDRDELLSGLHAAQHTLLGLLPLFVGTGDAAEVQCDCFQHSFKLMLFEKHAHGVGVAKRLYDVLVSVMQAAVQRLTECSCQFGCPLCCISFCSNRYFDKSIAIQIFRCALE